jgi:Leucine-rich repeat (LRR) protein
MNNDLTDLPIELYKLSNLDYLSVGYNKISQINSAVNNLKKLTYFGIFGNPITTLELTDKFINHLDFFSVWDTQLPTSYFENIKPKSVKTQVNSTGKGIK